MAEKSEKVYLCIACEFTSTDHHLFNRHLQRVHPSVQHVQSVQNGQSGERGESGEKRSEFSCSLCAFEGKNFLSLRTHSIIKHHVRGLKDTSERSVSARDNASAREKKGSVACVEKHCEYRGRNAHGLRMHLIRAHHVTCNDRQCHALIQQQRQGVAQGEGAVHEVVARVEVARVQERKRESQVLRCCVLWCAFTSHAFQPIKMHLMRKHKLSVESREDLIARRQQAEQKRQQGEEPHAHAHTGEELEPEDKERPAPPLLKAELYEEEEEEGGANEAEEEELRCSESDCGFVGKNETSLRMHVQNGHRRRREEERRVGGVHFRCQFPRCGHESATQLSLQKHIRDEHKSGRHSESGTGLGLGLGQGMGMAKGEKKCYFPQCRFQGLNLREHLLAQHAMAAKDSPTFHTNGQKEFRVFKCSLCDFNGSLTQKGLKIHVRRNHAHQKLVKSSGGGVSGRVARVQSAVVSAGERESERESEEVIIETALNAKRNHVLFKCSKCLFSSQSLIDLRKHVKSHN